MFKKMKKWDGVIFYWLTMLPIEISGQTATITGKKGKVIIKVPLACTVKLRKLPLLPKDNTT
jgi:hypothetical protein